MDFDSEAGSQAPSSIKPGLQPIISESDPDFGDVALRFAALQESSGDFPIPNARPSFRPSHLARPSHSALEEDRCIDSPDRDSNCRGDTSKNPKPTKRVADNLNCAVWLFSLPCATTVADLAQMTRTVAIHSMHIVPAQHGYPTAAISIIFMKHSAAEAFLMQSEAPHGLWIRGARIKAIYNKHGESDRPQTVKSRVLQIKGPSEKIDLSYWQKFFTRCVEYQLSHVRLIRSGHAGKAATEFGIARMRGQADSILKAINDQEKFQGIFEVQYAPDPCDPNPPRH
jgi:hypothetical protein